MIYDGANKEDIIWFLQDKNVPGDEIVYNDLADELDHLREMKQAALTENAEREGLKQRIAEMKLNTLPEQSA